MQASPALLRSFGLRASILLIISSIIGSGVFKKVAPMMAELGSSGWVLAAWAVAGLVSLAGALTVAEVAGRIAGAGGAYDYLREMYGEAVAFLYGWGCFAVIETAAVSSIAYVFAESVHAVIPLPDLLPGVLPNAGIKLVAISLVLILMGINIRGAGAGGWISKATTATVVLSLMAIIVLGLTSAAGNMAHFAPESALPPARSRFDAFFVAMLSAFWAYKGWMSLSFLGAEIKDPLRNIPRAFGLGVLAVIAIYLLVNAAYLYVLPPAALAAVHASGSQIAAIAAMEQVLGSGGRWFIAVLILISTLGCTNATLLMTSRIGYAMAGRKLFFPAAGRIHPRYSTPAAALLMQGGWACILILSGSFDQLTDMLVFAEFIFYGLIAAGVFLLRKKHAAASAYRTPGYPLTPALFALFCLVLVTVTLYSRPWEALAGLGLILTGLPFYFYWKKQLNSRDSSANA
ncbi:MAG: amino acid permease [Bacteroidia bacterium]|nr:amino acid permease [Bacteroidia bacterium]